MIKTLQFKLRLNKTEIQSIENWLEMLRWVWNDALEQLIELDTFTASFCVTHQDGTKEWKRSPCCPIAWQYRRVNKKQPWGEGNIAPYTYLASDRPYRQFCPVNAGVSTSFIETNPVAARWCADEGLEHSGDTFFWNSRLEKQENWRSPRLTSSTFFSLCAAFSQSANPDKPWLKAIPSKFVRGTLKSLSKAWDKYKQGKGGKPRFKRRGDATGTLINEDGKTTPLEIKGNHGVIRIPKLGVFTVPHLGRDWVPDVLPSVVKIAKRPDGYYLQLTGVFPDKPIKPKQRAIALKLNPEPGALALTDQNKLIYPFPEDYQLHERLEKLQKLLATQTYLSGRWKKTKRKIARIHQTLARRADAYNHKVSTFIVRSYGSIEIQGEPKKVVKKPKRRVKKGTIDPIAFDPNGASEVALINQERASLRTGQFVQLIKTKSKTSQRALSVK